MIPKVAVDGVYGNATAQQVKVFQEVFNLPKTGIVDYATWYMISDVYVGVSKIAELRSSNVFYPPESRNGYRGIEVPHFRYPVN